MENTKKTCDKVFVYTVKLVVPYGLYTQFLFFILFSIGNFCTNGTNLSNIIPIWKLFAYFIISDIYLHWRCKKEDTAACHSLPQLIVVFN